MADVKRTQREMFNAIIAYVRGEDTSVTKDEIVKFAEGRITLLDKKKASGSGKPTARQEANEKLKAVIYDTLVAIGSGTVSDIQNANAELGVLSNQKVSAVTRLLVKDGRAKRNMDGKRAVFTPVVE